MPIIQNIQFAHIQRIPGTSLSIRIFLASGTQKPLKLYHSNWCVRCSEDVVNNALFKRYVTHLHVLASQVLYKICVTVPKFNNLLCQQSCHRMRSRCADRDLLRREKSDNADKSNSITFILSSNDLKRTHFRLRHGSKTVIIKHIRFVERWSPSLIQILDGVLKPSACSIATPSKSDAIMSANFLSAQKHEKS